LKAAKGTVGQKAGLNLRPGVPLGLVAGLILVLASLIADQEAGARAGASLVLLVGLLCLRRARNVVLQVDQSLQHLRIARGPGLGPGPDQLTVAIKLYITCPGDLFKNKFPNHTC
jgi:hypothetical protein